MKYPLCESLGLRVWNATYMGQYWDGIAADELEAILEKAPIMYGNERQELFQVFQGEATHRARLIGVEKLKKGVTKAEIVSTLNMYLASSDLPDVIEKLAARIKSEGIIE